MLLPLSISLFRVVLFSLMFDYISIFRPSYRSLTLSGITIPISDRPTIASPYMTRSAYTLCIRHQGASLLPLSFFLFLYIFQVVYIDLKLFLGISK
ncbi:hypothetical protein SERLADRAFT_481185 [Serpula lacrymans var. lacrymans S7.9]|uniref:Uncharacterized protein n=1 Tax=Serpula lacrymans var. lacrymans (strain S7.9) TaxID=578457 RepID=F8PES1_SERL9|nr:uncharacterized protein SERLADRAFT_481185 [Serpula lacrymans var. lacrymans S7.9]EGO18375.1 hypothetical protein SERLADRAFT_481185 [Serpula lacrymans var. lacrymans S7.9]